MQLSLDDLEGTDGDVYREPNRDDFRQPEDQWRSIRVPTQRSLMRRMTSTSRVEEAIGELEHDVTIHLATLGSWGTHNVLLHLLDRMGPADLTMATWAIGEEAYVRMLEYQDRGILRSMRVLVDWRFTSWNGKVAKFVKSNADILRVAAVHAKIFVLRNEHWAFSYFGSANLTNNPRIEVQCLVESRELAEFHCGWIEECLRRGAPFGVVGAGTAQRTTEAEENHAD